MEQKCRLLHDTYMHVVAVLVRYNEQSSEGVCILDLHGLWGVQHGEAAHACDKRVAQHAHAQEGCDADGSNKTSQAQIDHRPCTQTFPNGDT